MADSEMTPLVQQLIKKQTEGHRLGRGRIRRPRAGRSPFGSLSFVAGHGGTKNFDPSRAHHHSHSSQGKLREKRSMIQSAKARVLLGTC